MNDREDMGGEGRLRELGLSGPGALESFLEAAPDGIIVVDGQGVIVVTNQRAERLFGYSREDLLGRRIEDLVPERYRERHLSDRQHYLREPRTRPMGVGLDLWGRRKDGSEFPTEISLSPLSTRRGTFIIAVVRDISEQKRFQAKLNAEQVRRESAIEALKARDEFLQIASHELKTPLTPLVLQLEMLGRALAKAGEQDVRIAGSLDLIKRQTARLVRLVDGLLDVARIGAGRLTLDRQRFDLAEVAREVSEQFAREAELRGARILVKAAEPAVGCWDRLRLEQLLSNLIANALKYGAGKPIEVELQGGDDAVRLVVRDQGLGIDEATLGRLFQRFERAASTRQYGGLGLGLYIARQIVEAHRGTITVQSEAGKGSTFIVVLPRAP